MNKLILTVFSVLICLTGSAQDASSYIVKTRHAQGNGVKTTTENKGELQDLITENFRFYPPCEWQEGMKFMVVPDSYDLMVNTFIDAETGKEVANTTLRKKIMVYQGHEVGFDGHTRMYFITQDDHRKYYYFVQNPSFEDFCYEKTGVPTLAYLGDVDVARTKLIGQKVYTKSSVYRIDTSREYDDFEEVDMPKDELVTVKAIGVGTRNYPVKIIVEDDRGNEFYQNVAISKTNCGMRDDEFTEDNAKYLFSGSFELLNDIMSVSKNYMTYRGKTVHTKDYTLMRTHGAGKDRNVKVPRQTTFIIDNLIPMGNTGYVSLTLTEIESRRVFYKNVTFDYTDNVTGDVRESLENYFGYVFAMGEGKARQTSQAARAAIRQGYVIIGMSRDEVQLAMGEPDRVVTDTHGHTDWIYVRSTGKLLVVKFDMSGKVSKYEVDASTVKKKNTTIKATTQEAEKEKEKQL